MRPARKLTAVVALGAAAVFALAGCTKKNEEAPAAGGASTGTASGQTYKVAFVPKLQGVPYFEAMNDRRQEGRAPRWATSSGSTRARPRPTPRRRPTSCGPTSSRRSTR